MKVIMKVKKNKIILLGLFILSYSVRVFSVQIKEDFYFLNGEKAFTEGYLFGIYEYADLASRSSMLYKDIDLWNWYGRRINVFGVDGNRRFDVTFGFDCHSEFSPFSLNKIYDGVETKYSQGSTTFKLLFTRLSGNLRNQKGFFEEKDKSDFLIGANSEYKSDKLVIGANYLNNYTISKSLPYPFFEGSIDRKLAKCFIFYRVSFYSKEGISQGYAMRLRGVDVYVNRGKSALPDYKSIFGPVEFLNYLIFQNLHYLSLGVLCKSHL